MQVVDGREGGGQLVRAAVSFAALSGEPVRVENARRARDPPGLKAQHVAAVAAVADVCDADIEGVEIGSTRFEFDPGAPRGGTESVDVGTAGSIMLVFDAVLPLATGLDDPLTLTVSGGTDVQWAPTLDFYRYVKLPLLRDHGLRATIDVERRGFYPAGGGMVTLTVEPSRIDPLVVTTRGERARVHLYSTAASSLEDAAVATRQAQSARQRLPDETPVEVTTTYVDTRSPGSVLDVVADFEHARCGFSALGRRGKPAAEVAADAVAAFDAFCETGATVDRHLADQLMPFLALAGGEILAPEVTNHVETQAALLKQFGYGLTVEADTGANAVRISAPTDAEE